MSRPVAQLDRTRVVNRLVVALREDVAAHERVRGWLETQERFVAKPGEDAFRDATLALERELARTPHRATQRTRAMADLASSLGVPASAMTLASAIERLGEDGAGLAAERDRLREVAEDVRTRNLRVAALVRMHRAVTRELIQVVLGAEHGDVHGGGTLIDAEV